MSNMSLVEDIFLAALEKGTPEERAAYLEQACKGDPELRRRVERLLEAHPKAGDFLENPALPPAEATAAHVPSGEQVGTVIAGRYKLLEQIGEGGMGTVWVAEQIEPVRRKVALKLIKAGMDSQSVLARFEAERQALALMDHPNIAKVLDGGVTEQGRPFFVMEYVKGVPLTQYCDDARLTVEERLGLFIPVCQAVQHAHQKGIVHRDLKPSNLLVCLYDGKPVPKVIDFGLAKAMHQPLSERTLHTAHGVMLGTPLYMSPEQAELNNLDVDTRTDVYSLGVILYELLTGTTPLEKQRFKEAAWNEMLRLIKEESPPRPSTRLSSTATSPSIAAQRQMEPMKLSRLLRGELDWIVMKALEKERGRRYGSPGAFAEDIERYLRREVVLARPPSAGYRMSKFARKHRGPVTAATAILLALVAGVIGTTAGLFEARKQRDAAREAEHVARKAEASAEERRRDAERFAAKVRVDLDLAEADRSWPVSLLRLARTLRSIPPDQRELREFVTLSILAGGQDFASLTPPLTHEGEWIDKTNLGPDGRTVLTLARNGTARLWDSVTGRRLADLGEGVRVLDCEYSPDGRSVFTDDEDGVVRVWDATDGSLRCRTEPRANRQKGYERAWHAVTLVEFEGDRLLTRAVRDIDPKPIDPDAAQTEACGPVELWDARTGHLIATLDGPGRDAAQFGFRSSGRFIATLENKSTVTVFSADDGRLLGQAAHPADEVLESFDISPNGQRLIVLCHRPNGESAFHVWEVSAWREDHIRVTGGKYGHVTWRSDELFSCLPADSLTVHLFRLGRKPPVATDDGHFNLSWHYPNREYLVQLSDGRLCNYGSSEIVSPPPGRSFHPDLSRFAPDGRFARVPGHVRVVKIGERTWFQTSGLLDTVTDRVVLHTARFWLRFRARFGYVSADDGHELNPGVAQRVWLFPTSNLDLAPDVLELWLQVALRGELGPSGGFVKWDEPTWERKRQELAAIPAPRSDLPFPGHVAGDRLHWLRQEYATADDKADTLRLVRLLLGRAEAAGDKAEIARWRAELDKPAK